MLSNSFESPFHRTTVVTRAVLQQGFLSAESTDLHEHMGPRLLKSFLFNSPVLLVPSVHQVEQKEAKVHKLEAGRHILAMQG